MSVDQKMLASILEPVRELAWQAGQEILNVYHGDFEVEAKSDGSPLTAADQAAHRTIVNGLAQLTPDIPIISEEASEIAYEERAAWDQFWLVDPLDGTREFVKRNGEFTVNIAFIDKNKPVLGVVHVPVTGVSYFACEGTGAFKQERNKAARPIAVSRYTGGKARIAGSRSHASDALKKFIDAVGNVETISMGSSLKLCLVAEGAADVYPRLGPTSEWDTAAAQAIVEIAGGKVTDIDNNPLRYNKKNILNPWFIVSDGVTDWTQYLRGSI